MKSGIFTQWVIIILVFLFLVSSMGCKLNDVNDKSQSKVPSVTITPASEDVDTAAVDKQGISRLEDLTKLDQIISIEEYELNDYYFEIYKTNVEYLGLSEALNDKFNYEIRYKSGDCEVIGFISAPADYLEQSYPILIYNRGGNGNFGEVNPDQLCLYAHMGYIVLATQYRGNDGGTGKEDYGGDDVQEVISLIDIAEQLPFTNGKLYMLGASRGGLETYCTLKEEYLAGRDKISAAVIAFGVSDLVKLYHFREQGMKDILSKYVGGTPEQVPKEYEKRSAVCWPELINTPLLIIHGKIDERAPVEQAETMYELLKEQNHDVELVLHKEGHGFTKETFLYAFEWLSSH